MNGSPSVKPNVTLVKRIWERAAPIIVFIAVVLAVAGFGWGLKQQHVSNTQGATIIAQNKRITQLLQQHTTDFKEQQQFEKSATTFDSDVYAFAVNIDGELKAICLATHAACPSLPPIPSP